MTDEIRDVESELVAENGTPVENSHMDVLSCGLVGFGCLLTLVLCVGALRLFGMFMVWVFS